MLKLSRLRQSMLAGVSLAVVAGPALAADLGPYPRRPYAQPAYPAYTSPFTWTGFYMGVQAGYGWGTTDAVSSDFALGTTEAFSYGTGGFLGGLHAGYNWQVNRNLVVGVESDIELADITGSGISSLGNAHHTSIDWLGSVRGRIGFAADSTLFYLTGGLAYGGVSIDRSAGAGFAPFASSTGLNTGWTLGGGIEHAFSRNITARIEYRYTDLGSVSWTNSAVGVADHSEVTHHAIRAGLSFRF